MTSPVPSGAQSLEVALGEHADDTPEIPAANISLEGFLVDHGGRLVKLCPPNEVGAISGQSPRFLCKPLPDEGDSFLPSKSP